MELDVIVIGTGQAGVPLATRLAHAGRRVAIVERAELGGTCSNYGCTPTKTLVASARAAHVARTASRLGVHVAGVRIDFAEVMGRKDAIVERWRQGVARKLDGERKTLRVIRGAARFVGERELEIFSPSEPGEKAGSTRERLKAETVIINVGARPAVPKLPGLDGVPWLDNRSVMALRELPRRLVVLGGGYIGCEFAQIFRRLGAEVVVIDRGRHLLSREDPDVSSALEAVFAREGIELVLGAEVERVARDGDGGVRVRAGGRELEGSHLLVALGRRPNTDDLGCDAGGIRLDAKGFVIADDHYRTSARGTFAVGDCAGEPQFTHTAWDDHRILFDFLTGRSDRGRDGRLIPYCVFTDPEVARVGLNETEARARHVRFELATMPFGQVARAIETDETAGVMKLLVDPDSERVLGATIVGAAAGELIHVFVTLMMARASARAVADAEFIHPTFCEGVQSLVMSLPRFRLE